MVSQLGLSPEQVTDAQSRAAKLKGTNTAPRKVAAVSDALPLTIK